MDLNKFTIQKNMIWGDDFHGLVRYLLWHLFLMSCCIDLGSILASLWHQIPCFGVIVFVGGVLVRIFDRFQKKTPNLKGTNTFFHNVFDPVPQEVFWEVPWFTLASFWFPFASFGHLFDSFWIFSLNKMLRVSFSPGRDRACRLFWISYFWIPSGKRLL